MFFMIFLPRRIPARPLPLPRLSFLLKGFDKSLNGAVIGSLHIVREKTGGQFSRPPMIGNAFTADSLPAAGLITAVTSFLIFLYIAFPHSLSSLFLLGERVHPSHRRFLPFIPPEIQCDILFYSIPGTLKPRFDR
jgi:hypothetical protein